MNGQKPITILFFLLLTPLISGCATMSDVARAKDEGTAKVYPVNTAQAGEIAKTVFRWEGADTIEETEGYMLASSKTILGTMGALMGVWIDPVDKDNTRVTVVTKRKVATNNATTLTEITFHKRFAQAVEIIKKGEKLTSTPPE